MSEQARSLLEQAERAKLEGKASRCIELAEQCWVRIADGDDRALQAACQRMLGLGHHHAGQPARSLVALHRAAELYEALDDGHSLARVLSVIACELASVGSPADALATAERAVELAAALHDLATEVSVWNNLGVVHNTLGDHAKAIAAAQSTLVKAEGIEHPHTRMHLRVRLLIYRLEQGTQELKSGDAAAAGAALETALAQVDAQIQACREAGYDHMVTSTALAAGGALLALRRHAQASTMLTDALALAHADGQLADEADIGLLLGIARREAGSKKRALTAMRKALAAAERIGQRELSARCHLEISRTHEELGELAPAFDHFRRYHDQELAALRAKADARVQIMSIRLDIERSRLEAEVLRLRAAELERHNLDLRQHAEELSRHAHEDPLTGLANRRHFELRMADLGGGPEAGPPLSVAIGDIDHFKRINDGFSHAVGDQVLRELALLMRDCFRPRDVIARFGGEEFVVAIVGATRAQARRAAERLREAVEGHDWASTAPGLRVTISVGLAQLRAGETVDQALARADAALYAAKHGGRNRLVEADPAVGE